MAGTAGGMRHDHDLGNAQLIDRYNEAAHGGVPGGGNYRTGVLDNLGIAIAKAEGLLQEYGQARVHAAPRPASCPGTCR